MNTSRFRFDGQAISKKDTAFSLKIADRDIIEVYQSQSGGAFGTNYLYLL